MDKEIKLLDVEIEKTKSEINDTSIGLSMLGIFFLAILPLFYAIMGIYQFNFKNIQTPLIISIIIVFVATILAVLHWENNTQKLKKLYQSKIELINKDSEMNYNDHNNINLKDNKKSIQTKNDSIKKKMH